MARHGCLALLSVLLQFISGIELRHECDRLCVDDVSPKNCFYQFSIGISRRTNLVKDEGSRYFLSVNGKRPGPMISVCQNDVVIVDVKNQLPGGIETSLHWHGFPMKNSSFMDGVPMITQCPIFPRTSFRYKINATTPGTFYYRAHSVAQQLDGIYGPLIVHNRHRPTFSNKVVIVSPQMKKLQVLQNDFESDLSVAELRVTVFNDSSDKGERKNDLQKYRIINAAALSCPIRLFTHTVPLRVVAIDGSDVKPYSSNEIVVNPGERIDLLVKPEVMKVTHIIGHKLCKGHSKYSFQPGISEKTEKRISGADEPKVKLELEKPEKLRKAELNIFLPFDISVFSNFKGEVDFRYKLGAIAPYAPSVLTKNSISLLQIHNKSFLYPPTPVLSQPDKVPLDVLCDLKEPSTRCVSDDNNFCECVQTIKVPFGADIDLFIIDEGKNSDTSQVIYIHGNPFFVLASKYLGKPISGEEIEKMELLGKIEKNLKNPIKRNTVEVPNKGYVVLRLRTDNPGKWLIESIPSKAATGLGLEVILDVEDPEGSQVPPKGFPTCHSMKEPDLVFSVD